VAARIADKVVISDAFGQLRQGKRQGNESRLTSEGAEDFEQVARIPGGAFSPSLDG
jgi:hypothetical protein